MTSIKKFWESLWPRKHARDSKDEPRVREIASSREGSGVHAQSIVDRRHLGPVLTPSTSGDGGLQGLGWFVKSLRKDEDGDVADEFLDEVSSEMPEALTVDPHKTQARFKRKNVTKPVKQTLFDGKIIQQSVEHKGRLH